MSVTMKYDNLCPVCDQLTSVKAADVIWCPVNNTSTQDPKSISMKYNNLCSVNKYEGSRCNKVSSKKHLNSRSQKYEYEL